MEKQYKLVKNYVSSFKTIYAGVIATEKGWMEKFPDLNKGDCEIKKDWFKLVERVCVDIVKRPQLGLTPKFIRERDNRIKRFNEVCEAIVRKYDFGEEIPISWIEEYNELIRLI
jgi:hypothetical protein